ncbi:MAG: isovaleryl-CoA dehydrogenase [Hyphomonadaceae bacterium]|jgi:putative acyl-CoA dehydrogenase|nr:isovaleryl-CoA dehydrogenase [Hyphomonadaceae bacterium]
MTSPFTTHEVLNQSPPFENVNLFTSDRVLTEAVNREGGGAASKRLTAFGEACGSAAAFERGRLANENPPRLRSFDSKGRRLDMVEFHPAYHECMAMSIAEGLHCGAWEHAAAPGAKPTPGANVARSASCYMAIQMEAGHQCPITMTNASVPVLLQQPDLAAGWLPKVFTREYDKSFQPIGGKRGATIGMGMTEKQGGTDVRANTTTAMPAGAGGPGAEYIITGHKWFMSAPMCDTFLVLAQAPGGLSCFLLPRFLPDGSVNALRFQRLKDKLGNRSNASSEVEFAAAHAWLVGEEGRGVPAIIEMVTGTRLDCAIGSAGLMRLALAGAIHHCQHRTAFQKKLVDHPLMQQVLADLALDVEAATALAFRLCRSFDRSSDPHAAAWRRLMTPVTKYWVCKLGPAVAYEAMECLGGNGYVEEGLAARLYRELPLNAIWEGSGNVMALDLLRVLQREPETLDVVMEDLGATVGSDPALKAHLDRIQVMLHEPRLLEQRGRALAEALATVAAGTILRAHAPACVADAFIATRLSGAARQTYGQGLDRADTRAIIERAAPRQ